MVFTIDENKNKGAEKDRRGEGQIEARCGKRNRDTDFRIYDILRMRTHPQAKYFACACVCACVFVFFADIDIICKLNANAHLLKLNGWRMKWIP